MSSILEELGAVVIDADRMVRESQQPGEPVLAAMVEAFGDGILLDDGTLNRQAVADIVFNDADQLKVLNGIVHPAVGARIVSRMSELAPTDEVVVLDHPLLLENGHEGMAAVIVVDIDPEIAVDRLVRFRNFPEADARARMANQIGREDRLAKADVVLDNSGTPEGLRAQVEALWERITAGEFTQPPAD